MVGGRGVGDQCWESNKKICANKCERGGGGSVGGVLNANKIWGDNFWGGGAFRKSLV